MNVQSKPIGAKDSSSPNQDESVIIPKKNPPDASTDQISEVSKSRSPPSAEHAAQTSAEPTHQDRPCSPPSVDRPSLIDNSCSVLFPQNTVYDEETDSFYGGETVTLNSKDTEADRTPTGPPSVLHQMTKNTIEFCRRRNLHSKQIVLPEKLFPPPVKNVMLCQPVAGDNTVTNHSPNAPPVARHQSSPESPKMVDIDGVLVGVQKLENGLEVTDTWDPILPPEDLEDPLFVYMTKVSQKNLNKSERLDMLYNFIRRNHISIYFHSSLKDLDTVKAMDTILRKTYGGRKKQRLYPLALKLYALYKIFKQSERAWIADNRRKAVLSQEFPEMKVFRAWVEKCEQMVIDSAVAQGGTKKKSRRLGRFQQPGGGTSFTISMRVVHERPLWKSEREPYACPNCGHVMLVIVNREEDIHKHNNCRAKEYEHAVLEWEADGSNPKTEPCMPKGSKEEMLVCMCCVTQCKDKYTGSGCIVCEEYVTNSPDKMVPWDTNTAMCTCGPCHCKCSVYFP